MNALTDPLRQVARDLVDKKLWPIAVLLLVALIAVPLLIGSPSEKTPAPAAPVAGAPGKESLISVADQAVVDKDRPGKIRDPFYDPPDPPAVGSAAPAAPSAGSAPAGGSTGGGSTGGGSTANGNPGTPSPSTPKSAAPGPSTQPVAPAAESVHYRTVVRAYAGERGRPRPVSRLTPFGAVSDPIALYLGVTRSDALYAVFLLGSDATAQGEANCEDKDCRIIGLKAGGRQVITVRPSGGEPRRYRLEAVSVRAVTTDRATASTMRARVHPEGRKVMREMWQDARTAAALEPVRYDRSRGLLYKTGAAAKATG